MPAQFTSRNLHASPHTKEKSISANLIILNHLIIHFRHLQIFFKHHSVVQSPQTLNCQTNVAHLKAGGMPPPLWSHEWLQMYAWGAASSRDPGAAACLGSNFNWHKSISLPGINISHSNPFPGWDVNNTGCFYSDRSAYTQMLESVLKNLLFTPSRSWFDFRDQALALWAPGASGQEQTPWQSMLCQKGVRSSQDSGHAREHLLNTWKPILEARFVYLLYHVPLVLLPCQL